MAHKALRFQTFKTNRNLVRLEVLLRMTMPAILFLRPGLTKGDA